ncbi:MAG TPA: POTRA domain-containing protein, partial [Gemmataceae bacterium]
MQAMERFLLVHCAGAMLCLLFGGRSVPAQEPAPAGKQKVSDVVIQGSRRMSAEQIKVQLSTQVGKEFNPAALDEDVRKLYKTNQFSNIQTFTEPDGPGRVKVRMHFLDLPNKVQKVTFLGAKHLKE